jgi:hypothetical protein
MNVILQGDGSPYGVLEVDSRSEGEFSVQDISFLQGTVNILGGHASPGNGAVICPAFQRGLDRWPR